VTQKIINIALDCMGGDRAPQIVIEGAEIIASSIENCFFLLFGDASKINPILIRCPNLKNKSSIFHTSDYISSSEKPSNALRRGTKSSMRLAIDALKNNQCHAVISAGNTGALMAISKVVLRLLDKIERPAIITSIPNQNNSGTIFLDMGANIDSPGDVLYQFGIMGHAFSRIVNKVDEPKIGILNVGSEELKGNNQVREAAEMLKNSHLAANFYGYVEGDDITKGTVDVVVTDGFCGNITLKAIEGTAKMVGYFIKKGFMSSFLAKIGYLFAGHSIKETTKIMDPRNHNGAMLIGLNGIVVKSHGSTDNIGFANAIKVALSLVENEINNKIIAELNQFNPIQNQENKQTIE